MGIIFILFTDANIYPLTPSLKENRVKRNAIFVVGILNCDLILQIMMLLFLLFCKIK